MRMNRQTATGTTTTGFNATARAITGDTCNERDISLPLAAPMKQTAQVMKNFARRKTRRILAGSLATTSAFALLSVPSAHATPFTWTNSTSTGTLDWTTAGNWLGSNPYVSDAANELIFFSDSTTNINTTGARNITTNVPTTLSMNTLTLNGKGASSGAVVSTYNIGSSASTWTIGDGTTSIVNLNGTQGATTAAGLNYNIAANLTLNQANTLFTGNGTGGVHTGANDTGFVFSGNIGQAAIGYGITKSGSSRLTLSGNLTFTGALTVDGGMLILTGNSNPAFAITVNTGATLRIGNNTATQLNTGNFAGNISTGTGGTVQLWSTSAQELSGVISGAGGISKAYGGTLTLSGANTYTGKTQFLPQSTAGFTVNVASFNSVVGGTASSSLGAPTTIANGTIDLGSGSVQAGVNLTYVSTATGETTDRVINIGFNGSASHTITANNSTGILRFTSAFTSNAAAQTGQLILRGTGAGQIDLGLPQLATGGLNKNDSGTWTLGGSGNFTGPTIITAGTLNLSSATALRFSPFNTASVAGGPAAGLKIATTTLSLGGLTGTNAFDSRFTTALGGPSNATASGGYAGLTALTLTNASGTTSTYSGGLAEGAVGMTLTKNGAGTQYISGTIGYTGSTTVNAGTLGSNSTFSGSVTVATGAGLAPGASAGAIGTLTISNATASALTLNGSNLLMDLSTGSNDLIAVTGTTVLNGTNTVLPSGTSALADGTYTIMTYGAKTGAGSVLFANGTNTLGNATLAVNAGNIQITVAGGGLNNSVWVGSSGTWDSGTNWNRNGTPGSAFVAGDFVLIDDTGTTTTITSAAAVLPTSVTVNNSTKAFTISATIGGSTPVAKLGTNTLTLSGTNTYSGGTFIGGGRVGITANANLGDAAGTITFNGGELYITNDFSSARNVTLNAVAGNQVLLQGNADWTNSGTFTGDGGITFRQNPNGGTSATLTSTANDFKGDLGIQANNGAMTVRIRSIADSASANGNIVFGASTQNQIFEWDSAGGSSLTLNNRAVEFAGDGNASGTIRNANTTNAIIINTALVSTGTGVKTLTLDAVAGPTNVYDGSITDGTGGGSVALTKAGAGLWVLSGSNSYSGSTSINAGTLSLTGGNNRLPSTGTVAFTGASTLNIGSTSQTLAAVTVPNLAGFTSTINGSGGTLTINGASDLQWGPGGQDVAATTYNTVVNLSGLTNFVFNASGNTFRVGYKSGTTNSGAAAGTSTVTLAASNTITAATLAIGDIAASNHGGTGTLRVGAASILNVANINVGTSGRSNGTLDFNAPSSTVTIRNTDGASPVTAWNIGKALTFNTTTWTGAVNFSNGTLDALVTTMNIGAADAGTSTGRAGITNGSFVMAGGSLTVGTLNLGQYLSGAGATLAANQTFAGNGTFTLNSASGTVNATTINLATNTGAVTNTGTTRLVSGTFNLTNGTLNATTVQQGPQGGAATATVAFNWATGTIGNRPGTDLTWSGVPITLTTSGAHTFAISGSNTATLDSTSIISGVGFGITKAGSGTLTLTSASTYTGATNVDAGKLVVGVNGVGSLGSTSVLVNNTGTLGGSGTIAGPITVNSGGAISPGNSVGTLTTGAETWNGGGSYIWEITSTSGTAGTDWDLIQMGGNTLTITATSGNKFTIVHGSGSVALGAAWHTIAEAGDVFFGATPLTPAGGGGAVVTAGFDPSAFELPVGWSIQAIDIGTDGAGGAGQGYAIQVSAVPEPGAIGVLALAGIGLLSRRSRRRSRDAR